MLVESVRPSTVNLKLGHVIRVVYPHLGTNGASGSDEGDRLGAAPNLHFFRHCSARPRRRHLGCHAAPHSLSALGRQGS
jgi:hypothetical protein